MTKNERAELFDRIINPLSVIKGVTDLKAENLEEVINTQVDKILTYLKGINVEEDSDGDRQTNS